MSWDSRWLHPLNLCQIINPNWAEGRWRSPPSRYAIRILTVQMMAGHEFTPRNTGWKFSKHPCLWSKSLVASSPFQKQYLKFHSAPNGWFRCTLMWSKRCASSERHLMPKLLQDITAWRVLCFSRKYSTSCKHWVAMSTRKKVLYQESAFKIYFKVYPTADGRNPAPVDR